jgi:hypothetical protein
MRRIALCRFLVTISNLVEFRLPRRLLLGFLFASACVATANAGDVIVYPGNDLATLAKISPPGTKFVLSSGKHYTGEIQAKDGQSFVGQPGAILSGAVRLGPFMRDGRIWRAKGPWPLGPGGGECLRDNRTCRFDEVLFVDGAPLRRVLKSDELGNDTWQQICETGDVFVGIDPAGHLVEMSYRREAFYGTAHAVPIRGLVIEQYASTAQHGAIQANDTSDPEQEVLSTGWQILDSDMRFNSGGGVPTGNGMLLKGNRIYKNGQIGVVGAGAGIVVDSNDIIANNALGYFPGWEAGATKFVLTDQLQVRNDCVCDNLGPGIWLDVENLSSTIVGNWSVRNSGIGIYNEIGGRALIEGNTVAFNGSPGETPWNSQILVSGSVDTTVQGNRVEAAPDYGHAIFIVEEERKNEFLAHIHDYPTYMSRRNVVANNDITFYGSAVFGGVPGFLSGHRRIVDLAEDNCFEANSIHVVQGTPLLCFRYAGEHMELERAQQRGQEIHSHIDFAPAGTTPNFDMKRPPGVGRDGAP